MSMWYIIFNPTLIGRRKLFLTLVKFSTCLICMGSHHVYLTEVYKQNMVTWPHYDVISHMTKILKFWNTHKRLMYDIPFERGTKMPEKEHKINLISHSVQELWGFLWLANQKAQILTWTIFSKYWTMLNYFWNCFRFIYITNRTQGYFSDIFGLWGKYSTCLPE